MSNDGSQNKTTTTRRVVQIRRNNTTVNPFADLMTDSPVLALLASFCAGLAVALALVQSQPALLSLVLGVSMNHDNSHHDAAALRAFRDSLGSEWDLWPESESKDMLLAPPETVLRDELEYLQTAANKESLLGKGPRIVNSYIQNATLLQQLANRNAWTKECQDKEFWLLDLKELEQRRISKDENAPQFAFQHIWEQLAYQIWSHQPEFQGAVVLEYWCNVLTPSSPLGWHLDKDELLLQEQQQWLTPTMGAVFYGYPHDVRGGYLEVLQYGALSEPNSRVDGARREIERLRPAYNRLVYLNVSHWHRVSPVVAGERFTLAVNVWHTPPLAHVRGVDAVKKY